MNSTPEPARQQRTKPPLSETAKASLARTHTLFRIFVVSVLGAFFVYQLDVSYLWLTAILTAAGLALGVVLLVRAARLKESKLVFIGTISGLVVSVILVLLIVVTAVFFNEVRDYQACLGRALTDQAQSACRVQLESSLPTQIP
jgi:phosphoglycerol transferase MdoB-like AlkP superfamily enzyme